MLAEQKFSTANDGPVQMLVLSSIHMLVMSSWKCNKKVKQLFNWKWLGCAADVCRCMHMSNSMSRFRVGACVCVLWL